MPDELGYWDKHEPGFEEHKAKVALALHRLHHAYGACPCSSPPPEVTFSEQLEEWRQRGRQAADESTARGVSLGDITDQELIALGRAAREADLRQALEQVKRRNQIELDRLEPGQVRPWEPDWMTALERRSVDHDGQAPEPGTTATPDISDIGGSSGVDQGQGRPQRRERSGVRGGKPRVRSVSYISNNRGVRDPMQYEPDDDDWS
jgi:hypothetical protein